MRHRIEKLLGISLTLGILACSQGEPPLDELPLREALVADPAAILAMNDDAKKSLAVRYELAREEQAHEPLAAGEGGAKAPVEDLLHEVNVAQDVRAAAGKEPVVVGRSQGGQLLPHHPLSEAASEPGELSVEGDPPEATRAAEERALAGEAGAIVREVAEEHAATRIVRVVGWPSGVVVFGETVYVNGGWLVAMASSDKGGPAAARGRGLAFASRRRAQAPPLLSTDALHGNPYDLYPTLANCVADVKGRCDACNSGGACDGTATLTDVGSAADECKFLEADPTRPAALCTLAFLSIDTLAVCVAKKHATCHVATTAPVQASLAGAVAFDNDATCAGSLDACLSGSTSSTPSTSPRPATSSTYEVKSGCESPTTSCSDSCAAIGTACASGACSNEGDSSCSSSSCNSDSSSGSCSSCDSSSSSGSGGSCGDSCGGSGGSGGSCGGSGSGSSCETAPVRRIPAPVGGRVPWIFGPMVIVGLRAFRRRRKGARPLATTRKGGA